MSSCYCAGSGNKCHNCIVEKSKQLYKYKDPPVASCVIPIFAIFPAVFIGFVVHPMFIVPIFVLFLVLFCCVCNVSSNENEKERIDEYNRNIDKRRQEYIDNYSESKSDCILI